MIKTQNHTDKKKSVRQTIYERVHKQMSRALEDLTCSGRCHRLLWQISRVLADATMCSDRCHHVFWQMPPRVLTDATCFGRCHVFWQMHLVASSMSGDGFVGCDLWVVRSPTTDNEMLKMQHTRTYLYLFLHVICDNNFAMYFVTDGAPLSGNPSG